MPARPFQQVDVFTATPTRGNPVARWTNLSETTFVLPPTHAWLIETGVLPDPYVAAQGTRLGRLGRAHLERAGGEVWVGGGTHTVVDGTIEL